MKRAVSVLVVLLAGIHTLQAAYPKVRNFPKNWYKGGAQSWDVAQTSSGCVYFANHTGLLEFDGSRWDHYYVENGTAIRSLEYVEEEGRLYAGAFDEFGYYQPGSDGRLRYVSMKGLFPDEDLMTEFWNIHSIDNSLYFCTDWDIFKYTEGNPHVFRFGGRRIDCSATIYNTLFVSTRPNGPMILTGEMFISLPGASKLEGKKVCAMMPWSPGEVLIVTDTDGLYLYDGSDIVKYTTRIDRELCQNQIYCAALDDRSLALGTIRDGLYIIDRLDGQIIHLNRSSGLQNNTVLSLFFDMDSNLWLGLDNGIDYVMLDLPDYPIFSKDIHLGAGYSSLVYRGVLYLGTNQGLFCAEYTPRTHEISGFRPVGNSIAQVWCLAEIDGTLFCGHDSGLLIIDGRGVRNIADMMGVWKVMPLKGRSDMILGCSYQGLFVLKKKDGVWELSHMVEGINESSSMFLEDDDGAIWFSHWMKGLFRLEMNEEKTRVVSMRYYGEMNGFPTERNNIPYRIGDRIVFSSEGGFYEYDPATDMMVYETELNPLFLGGSPVSIRIHDMGQGDIVFISGTFCGVALRGESGGYALDSLSLRHVAPELIIGFESLTMLDDETLLVSNQNGFSLLNLSRLRDGTRFRSTHPVFIKEVWLTNRSDALVFGERSAIHTQNQMPKLAYRDNSLCIEVASPEYRDQDAVEYSFKLDGYDESWTSFSSANTKEYTYLSGGNYTLNVRSRNNFTQQMSQTSLTFSVAYPWYLSNVARGAYILLSVGLVWIILLVVNRRSDRRVNEMKRQKEREMKEQKRLYEKAAKEKEKELVLLQNRALEYNLRNKSQELASSTLNLIRKNEILMEMDEHIGKVILTLAAGNSAAAASQLRKIQKEIRDNIEHDSDWEKFAHNFDMVYENYLKRLAETFPQLNLNDKRLCAYLRMDLQSKDIAPLMSISVRSVEMARYRLRKKMGLSRDVNLSEFLQRF